jgi:hypothetical protein
MTDPHIGWWRERRRLALEIDNDEDWPHEASLADRQNELDGLIVGTPPTSLDGAAIVATVLLWWRGLEPQHRAGGRSKARRAIPWLAISWPVCRQTCCGGLG